MGIYDTPVDAFAALNPASRPSRRRKTPAATSAGESDPTPSQVATNVAQDFYDSVNGLVDFQKIRTVALKAIKGGYRSGDVLTAFQRAHKDGRPLTAEVLHQYLEGYVRPGTANKAIHYAPDRKRDESEYLEDL